MKSVSLAAPDQRQGLSLKVVLCALFVLSIGVATCRAESSLQTAPGGGRIAQASAHVDFQIIIQPSLGLSIHAGAAHIQANSGVLALQHDSLSAWDGQTPASAVSLHPSHAVIDTRLPAGARPQAEMLTVASP